MRKRKRILIAILCVFFLVALLGLFCGPVCFNIIRYGDSDIYDYRIFPSRKISSVPNHLILLKDTTAITSRFRDLREEIALDKFLAENHTLSFIISRNDSILFEHYYNSADIGFYSIYFSITKSVMSLLIGCAIDDKLIDTEYDSVTKYIPEFKDKGFKNISILDLLNMQAPLNYTENSNPFGKHVKFYYTPELESAILSLTAKENGKKEFVYRSGEYAILGLILKRVLKSETITHYLERRIWIPLRMENPGFFSIDHEKDGIEKVWCCLAGTARDLLRIANLYIHKGRCGDNQVVSESWINKTLSPLYSVDKEKEYNYGWWLFSKTKSIMAVGKDGQFAYINPAKSIVIIRLGDGSGKQNRNEWNKLFSQIADTF